MDLWVSNSVNCIFIEVSHFTFSDFKFLLGLKPKWVVITQSTMIDKHADGIGRGSRDKWQNTGKRLKSKEAEREKKGSCLKDV